MASKSLFSVCLKNISIFGEYSTKKRSSQVARFERNSFRKDIDQYKQCLLYTILPRIQGPHMMEHGSKAGHHGAISCLQNQHTTSSQCANLQFLLVILSGCSVVEQSMADRQRMDASMLRTTHFNGGPKFYLSGTCLHLRQINRHQK